MGLKKLPYLRLEPLIREHLSVEEDDHTVLLIRRLSPAKRRGYVTAEELAAVCRWKSPRALHYIRSNSATLVQEVTRTALSTRSEQRRLEALLELRGVSVPMASALLMLLDPQRYGVIDIRVWQLLHAMGTVTTNPRGIGFTFKHWYQLLVVLRHYAKKLGVSVRDIERTLFLAHKEYQSGRLYQPRARARA